MSESHSSPAETPLSHAERAALLAAAADDGVLGGFYRISRMWRRTAPAAAGRSSRAAAADPPLASHTMVTGLIQTDQVAYEYRIARRRLFLCWFYPLLLLSAISLLNAIIVYNAHWWFPMFLSDFDVSASLQSTFRGYQIAWPIFAFVTGGTFLFLLLRLWHFLPMLDRLLWQFPLIGRGYHANEVGAMAAMVTIALESHQPLDLALRGSSAAMASPALKSWARRTADRHAAGESILDACNSLPGGDEILSALIASADAGTISLASAWQLAANYYRKRTQRQTDIARFAIPVVAYLLTCLGLLSVLTFLFAYIVKLIAYI